MERWVGYAVPAIIVVTTLGAIVMCALVLAYGFAQETEEEPEERLRRLFVTRLGHAFAAACFALAAVLGSVVLLQRPPGTTATAPPAPRSDAETAELRREVETLRARVAETETAARQAESAARRAEAMREPAPTAPERPAPPASPTELPPRKPPLRSSPERPRPALPPEGLALPRSPATHQLTASVAGARVELESGSDRAGEAWYRVRLFDASGHPLPGARLTLEGRADGTTLEVPMGAGREPGAYLARSRVLVDPAGLRLHVVAGGRRFEVGLAQAVDW